VPGARPDGYLHGVDLYVVLGVAPTATTAELRRAYRRLALQHHPDRAGPASAPTFARIAEAYGLLSDPGARAAYDAYRLERSGWQEAGGGSDQGGGGFDGRGWSVATPSWSASWRAVPRDLLARLSGELDALIASGVARLDRAGALELHLTAREAARGGTVMVTMPLRVLCSTCGGVAERGRLWCRTCNYDGHVTEAVAVKIWIPPAVPDGFLADAKVSRAGDPPRVRIRLT
jgi:molecular chaperone DnaJ